MNPFRQNFGRNQAKLPARGGELAVEGLTFKWLGYPDSNQEKQNQNLLCYHYTISQS